MNTSRSQQYVTFQLGSDQYGVVVTQAREILDLIPVTKVPQVADDMLGVINLRGQVVPIVDMHRKLGLPNTSDEQNRCIIVVEVQVDDELLVVGILVDEVREVLELRDDMIEPPPRLGTRLNARFLRGMGKVGENFLILLDIDRLFNETELDLFQNTTEDIDSRLPETIAS